MQYPPHFIASSATVQNALIAEGCNIYGALEYSVIFGGVTVAPNATVEYSIVMPGTRIEEGASVRYAIVGENAVIRRNAQVGGRPEDAPDRDKWGIAVVGGDIVIGEGQRVAPNEMVDHDRMGVENI